MGELMVNVDPVKIKDIGKVKQLATGIDHVLFLKQDGSLMAMGDDTFGQCGTGGEGRQMTAPFFEARHRKPVLVDIPKGIKIRKVVCGFRHSLAISEDGKIYGWGYNN